MTQKFFVYVFLFCTAVSFSQALEIEEVTKAELKQTQHELDTAAVAAFLYKKGRTYFKYSSKEGFVSFTEIALKLKIYKKEGLQWANFEIPYYTGYKFLENEAVDIKKSFTYNLENDKIIKVKLTDESKFNEVINDNWSMKKITFPAVKVGSVIQFNYEIRTEDLSELPDFQFQYEIPVNKIEYTTRIPEFYIYKGFKTGFVDLDKTAVFEETSQSFENQYKQTLMMNYKQIKTTYTAQNVEALTEEEFVYNIDSYMGKIMHELEIIRMPEETPKPIAMSWSDIAKAIHAEKEFGGELQKNKYFLDDLRNIIKENDTLETKMTKVFNHVKNKMNWDGKLGYWTKIGVEKAYAEKVGNVAEINLILTAMLRLSGLEAHPIILSTKDNGVALFPNKTFLNYIITSVNINGKVYLLDATDKVSDINLLPVRALNQFGILIKNDGTAEEIPLLPKSVSLTATTIMAEINNNAEVIGKVRNQYAAYSAYFFKDKSQGVSSESLMESLEKKYAGLEVSNYSLTKNNDLSKPLVESYSFVSTNAIEKIGDTMYIAPFLFLTQTENPFKQETRKYPIDFIYPSQTKYNINLKIPPGYSLEKLPKPKALSLPENLGSMRYNISLSDNMIQILYTFEVSQASINADYYEALKSFYKEIINKQTEKIVLKKG